MIKALERPSQSAGTGPQFPFLLDSSCSRPTKQKGDFPNGHQRRASSSFSDLATHPEAWPPRESQTLRRAFAKLGAGAAYLADSTGTFSRPDAKTSAPPTVFYFATLYARVGDPRASFSLARKSLPGALPRELTFSILIEPGLRRISRGFPVYQDLLRRMGRIK